MRTELLVSNIRCTTLEEKGAASRAIMTMIEPILDERRRIGGYFLKKSKDQRRA